MPQSGQTRFKNHVAFATRLKSVSDHFESLSIKELFNIKSCMLNNDQHHFILNNFQLHRRIQSPVKYLRRKYIQKQLTAGWSF